MPCYFFDRDDTSDHSEDSEGLELPDLTAARHEAVHGLLDAARDEIDHRPGILHGGMLRGAAASSLVHHTISLRVRDGSGARFTASLKVTIQHHPAAPG